MAEPINTRSREASGCPSIRDQAPLSHFRSRLDHWRPDDDPSGIGTYGQAGAQFGYSFGSVILLRFPLMAAIQVVAGRGRRSVRSPGRRARLCSFHPWHHWHGSSRSPGSCRIGGLCARRGSGLDVRAQLQALGSGPILRHHRRSNRGRHGDQLSADQPRQGPLLERGCERTDCGADHGGDHVCVIPVFNYGGTRGARLAFGNWLGCGGGHGDSGCCHGIVLDFLNFQPLDAAALSPSSGWKFPQEDGPPKMILPQAIGR